MKKDEQAESSRKVAGRRNFLAVAAATSALGAAFALLAKKPEVDAAPAADPVQPDAANGYHETEHIRKYYSSAAF